MMKAGPAYTGNCHCQAVSYALHWPEHAGLLPARRCTCSYCTRFNGTWTSHPDAALELVEKEDAPARRYRFGTGTAEFLVCRVCGVVVAAICTLDGSPRAVVNINTLADAGSIEFKRGDSDFDGESLEERLERRLARWISSVTLHKV